MSSYDIKANGNTWSWCWQIFAQVGLLALGAANVNPECTWLHSSLWYKSCLNCMDKCMNEQPPLHSQTSNGWKIYIMSIEWKISIVCFSKFKNESNPFFKYLLLDVSFQFYLQFLVQLLQIPSSFLTSNELSGYSEINT